tara:strand:- start:14832 stop:15320 length:489 start_codon:yes stop_codon:yes gene_type:complete
VKKLLFAFLVIAVSCGSPAKNELVNQNIFNQTFETEDGAITLKEIFEENKKPMVINLWATWCTPCLEEMPYFEASHRKHFEKIQFIGINISDSPTRASKRAEELNISYMLGRDPDGKFTKSLNAIGLPVTAFFDIEGQLSKVHQGPMSEEAIEKSILELLNV